jgi:hypothetical protein
LSALDTDQVGGGDPPGLDRAALASQSRKVAPSQAVAGVEAPPLAGQAMGAA